MNQINLGAKAGIDTKEVQYWEMREVAGLQSTHVDFKNGITVILRGEAKAAFDEWAATLPRAGMRAGERQEGEQDDDVHGWTPPPEARRLCTTCRWHDPAVNGCRYPRRPKPEKPECYGVEEVLKANKPLCETCACYEAESGHCTEFAGNHYPECWVDEKAPDICGTCSRWHSSLACVADGMRGPKPGCYVAKGTAMREHPLTKAVAGKAELPYDAHKLSTPMHDHGHHHPEGDGSTALHHKHSHPEPHHEEEIE